MSDSKRISPIKVDTVSGSRSFNRFEFQLSQTLHMAIELYDTINYLLILDHYDDITLFDLDMEPLVVSYYQVKTSENKITIDSAIKDGWLSKLYAQMSRPEGWRINEIGLITNQPIEINYIAEIEKQFPKPHKTKIPRSEKLSSAKTKLSDLPYSAQEKIKRDVAKQCGVSKDDVDLSKFAHMRTTLSIEKHSDLVEKEIGDFLFNKNPQIALETVKTIYCSLLNLLTRKQEYEGLKEDAPLEEVQKYKGFRREDFDRIVDNAYLMSIPAIDKVLKFARVEEGMKYKLCYAYSQIVADSNKRGDESFNTIFKITNETMTKIPYSSPESGLEYGLRVGEKVIKDNPSVCIPYDQIYIAALAICLLINKARKES